MKRNPATSPATALLSLFAASLVAAGGAERPEGYTREVEAVLGQMLAAYRDAETYRDEGRLTIVQETGRVRQITKMPSTTAYARPGKLHVLGGMQSIACDGEELQVVLDALKQFQQRPAPEKLVMDHVKMGAPGAGLDQGYPEVLEFLLGENVIERWTGQMRKVAILNKDKPAVVAERECVTVSYETIMGADINLFVDAETHLLLRCDIDNTKAQQSPNAPPQSGQPPKLQVVLQLHPVEIGVELDDATFSLADPAAEGMRKVDAFEATAPGVADLPDNAPGAPTPTSAR